MSCSLNRQKYEATKRFVSLHLPFHEQGTLPPAIGALTALEVLRLDHNLLHGPIPVEALSLPRLRLVSLRHNNFSSAALPPAGSATLQVLDLGHNRRLTGRWLERALASSSGPAGGGDSGAALFPRLTTLVLDTLGLEGPLLASLPRACPALVALSLAHNRMDGPVPEWVALGLPALKRLDLSHNRFSGSLPAAVLVSGRWEEIKLFANSFTGPVPFKGQ